MKEADVRVFVEAQKRSRLGVAVMVAVCVALAVAGAVLAGTDARQRGIGIALAAAFGALAAVLVALALRDPEKSPIVLALRDRATDVVSVEEARVVVNGRHASTRFTLRLRDADSVTAAVRPSFEARARAAIEAVCVAARFEHRDEFGGGPPPSRGR